MDAGALTETDGGAGWAYGRGSAAWMTRKSECHGKKKQTENAKKVHGGPGRGSITRTGSIKKTERLCYNAEAPPILSTRLRARLFRTSDANSYTPDTYY
ncbi:hypothetical protein E2C01_084054 [Portunus trituberculatus]|uniref:Uncharacterized protein n=1 Tax=Portunus trituberculatus TaxID=210409 RepID=A0A5B7IYX1_PORTR|nr:hypothetical protein [Portunus trituberculatus]